jgi:hypothetical protein
MVFAYTRLSGMDKEKEGFMLSQIDFGSNGEVRGLRVDPIHCKPD